MSSSLMNTFSLSSNAKPNRSPDVYSLENKKLFTANAKELPENKPALLLSAVYSGDEQKVYLKLYSERDQSIFYWRDRTNHRPYCYTKADYRNDVEQVLEKEKKYSLLSTKKRDLISDKDIECLKISAPDPLSIGGTENSFREKVRSWEADIKYHENYLYDTGLIPGTYYVRRGDSLVRFKQPISSKVQEELQKLLWTKIDEEAESLGTEKYRQYIQEWADLLNQPIPNMKRVSIDIEVESEEGRIPNPREHDRRIIAVGFAASDGFRKVLLLEQKEISSNITDLQTNLLIPEAQLYSTEKELLEETFRIIGSYPIVITYNGDDFDLPYLYARSQDPAIDPGMGVAITKQDVPIIMKRESFVKRGIQAEPVQIKNGIHIDLFRTFQNRSVQIYAFSHKYSEYTLNAISEALLNDTKYEFEGDISELSTDKLAMYCLKDADLTFRLTSFNDNLLMKLLIVISRIGKMSIDDIARFGVNQWIRGMMYYEHRHQNALIPRRDELQAKGTASTTAIIKEKKYRGGLVVEPTLGIHFNVIVVDFASLYPSIIKVHNLSYETVNCAHQSCKNDSSQRIPETSHWTCKEKRGLTSLLIGSLRDLRVKYYKYLSKDRALTTEERQLYNVVSQAIKVILNASYGVMGAEIFPLYCLPVADATAAIGRSTTTKTIEKCKEIGIDVIYGDTDSLFLRNPSPTNVDRISSWARSNLGVDLEIDKQYRYIVFSELKKNYLGVLSDGTVDVKGLTGKKSHTPPFIRKAFYSVLDILSKVNSERDFESAKEKIKNIIQEIAKNLDLGIISQEDLSFNVMVNKSPSKYGKRIYGGINNGSGVGGGSGARSLEGKQLEAASNFKGLPQHIKAAKLLTDIGREVKAGDIISYVKTKTSDGVKPVGFAKPEEIDTEKYLETMEATFDQVLSSLNFNFKSLLGKPRQANLDELFWSK
ncbi:MAG: DNA-directed DNA polymerase I [Nitrososphaeraceae archaeon]